MSQSFITACESGFASPTARHCILLMVTKSTNDSAALHVKRTPKFFCSLHVSKQWERNPTDTKVGLHSLLLGCSTYEELKAVPHSSKPFHLPWYSIIAHWSI